MFNNISSQGKTGEVSRYYHQLKFESEYIIDDHGLEYDISSKYTHTLSIPKKDEIMLKLYEYEMCKDQKTFLSASALSDYISCPLKFCFKRVFDFQEKDDAKLSVSQRGFGNIFHYAMEEIYSGQEDLKIDKSFIINAKSKIDKYVNNAFKKFFKIIDEGEYIYKNEQIVIKEVIGSYIEKVLNFDLKKIPFEIKGVEKKLLLKDGITIKSNGKTIKLAFKAYIDRLDLKDNMLQLVDYKTGKADTRFNSVADLFEQKTGDKLRSVFQALIYIWTYINSEEDNDKMLYNQLYALKSIHRSGQAEEIIYGRKKIKDIKYSEWLNEFEVNLHKTIKEIFDANVPFEQTNEVATCKKCYFNRLCRR